MIDLSRVSADELEPVLGKAIDIWAERFSWDFRSAADLVRRVAQMKSLQGYALRFGRELQGYSYYVTEDRKAMIGDFFIDGQATSFGDEMLLLGSMIQTLMMTRGIRRIESQLMLFPMPIQAQLPYPQFMKRHDRFFMEVSTQSVPHLPVGARGIQPRYVLWADKHYEEVSHLIAASYRGHIDSEINDQYRTIPGARRFLNNITRFPGCGRFTPSASVLALDEHSGKIVGACLASSVSASSGHITQLCVLPAVRHARLGYELLRQSMNVLKLAGSTTVSLTVTCSNSEAIRLYESIGFKIVSTFPALVWEGF